MPNTILIVEDDRLCAGFLKTILHCVAQCDVQIASNASEALEVLEQTPVALLVTDLHMPVLDGFQLIERVRSQTQFAKMPILVISGDVGRNTAAQVRTLGANTYLPKPYSPAVLKTAVQNLMREA